MIKGIGVDIIEISRIKKAVDRSSRFLDRVFTKREQAYFLAKNMKMESVAGSFAAKEAVVKAMGTGLSGFKWTDIEIVRTAQGKPEVQLYNEALEIAKEKEISQFMVSISHCKEYAVANSVAL